MFVDLIRSDDGSWRRREVAKDSPSVGDVHVSTALGNEELPEKNRKRKRPRIQAFIDYSRGVKQVVPEERGPATNAEDGVMGTTVKRYDSVSDLPDAVKGKLKGKKRRQWMRVFNSSLSIHGDESRAFAEAWSTVKKSRSDTLSGEPMVGVGGRRLEPFDAGTFFVPMRYDPAALSYLRVDQVPHMLDALTHPNRLPVTPLAIADLTATKGRVSRVTIQKHLDKMAERRSNLSQNYVDSHVEGVEDLDPPIVVYNNGAFLLLDGHDRVVAMWLDGIDVVDAAFENIDDYDYRKPDPDDAHMNTAYRLLQGKDGRTLTNYVDGTLAVPFMTDLQFFSHLRPDQIPKFTFAVTHPDDLRDATLPLSTLVAIQNRVNADTVAGKVEKPSVKRPVIVRMNDVNYIADGHDRLAAAWLRGEDEAPVKLTDITLADNSMRPIDLVKVTIEDRTKAKEKLEEAERYARFMADRLAEVDAHAEEKLRETDRQVADRVGEADRISSKKRAKADRIATEKRDEAEKKLREAGLYVQQIIDKRNEVDRKKDEVDRYVAKTMEEADIKMTEADRYLQRISKEKDKLDAFVAKKAAKADRYAVAVRADADRYAADKRIEADRYEVEKKIELDQTELDRRREISRYELKRIDEVRGMTKLGYGDLIGGRLSIEVRKTKQDRKQVFGWASVATKDGVPIVDSQGDIIPIEALELAVYGYMLNSRDGSDMHEKFGVAKCIESVLLSKEKQDAMGISLPIEGWWVGMQILDDEVWDLIKSGKRSEFSIGGTAISRKIKD